LRIRSSEQADLPEELTETGDLQGELAETDDDSGGLPLLSCRNTPRYG
jgi:hypothetical protein